MIVCEIAEQERGSALFGREPIGFRETELSDGLWAISINPDEMVREYLEVLLPVRAMAKLLYRSNLFTYLAAATPGLREVVTMGKAWELAQDERRSPGQSRHLRSGDRRRAGDRPRDRLSRVAGYLPPDREGRPAGPPGGADRGHDHRPGLHRGRNRRRPPRRWRSTNRGRWRPRSRTPGSPSTRSSSTGSTRERFSAAELRRIDEVRERAVAGGPAEAALGAALTEAGRVKAQHAELERLRQLVPSLPLTELPFLFSAELRDR